MDGLPTIVVIYQLQVECGTRKVRQLVTDVLPLCYATNYVDNTVSAAPSSESEMMTALVWEGKAVDNIHLSLRPFVSTLSLEPNYLRTC